MRQTPNNGIVTLFIGGHKEKFIIHSYQDAKTIYDFFEDILGVNIKLNLRKRYKHSTGLRNDEYERVTNKIGILRAVGSISGLWMLFYPKPFAVLALINTVIPIIGIYMYVKYKYVQLDMDSKNDIPEISLMMFFPALALCFAAYYNIHNVIYKTIMDIYSNYLAYHFHNNVVKD